MSDEGRSKLQVLDFRDVPALRIQWFLEKED